MNALLLAQATTDEWAQTFFGLDQDNRLVLMVVAIACATIVFCTILGFASAAHRRRGETALKRELLERGMNADEIARLIEATQPTDFLQRWASGCKK